MYKAMYEKYKNTVKYKEILTILKIQIKRLINCSFRIQARHV